MFSNETYFINKIMIQLSILLWCHKVGICFICISISVCLGVPARYPIMFLEQRGIYICMILHCLHYFLFEHLFNLY